MKLNVIKSIPRSSHQDSNQFIKLHPSTIRRLWLEAITCSDAGAGAGSTTTTGTLESNDNDNAWNIYHEREEDVQFLPLRLEFTTQNEGKRTGSDDHDCDTHTRTHTQVMYGSYNGGMCDIENAIHIPQSFHENANAQTSSPVQVNVNVNVNALSSIQNASSIHMEPLSTSGWELLEIYAQELEEGIVLGQISVVYPGQIFSLSLGTATVPVRILDDGFYANANANNEGSSSGNERREHCSCLRLVKDTEVIVAPKARSRSQTATASSDDDMMETFLPSTPMKVLPHEMDFSADMKHLHNLTEDEHEHGHHGHGHGHGLHHGPIPSPPPFTAWMNPHSIEDVPGWDSGGEGEGEDDRTIKSSHTTDNHHGLDDSFVDSSYSVHALARRTRRNGTPCIEDGNEDVALVELVSSEFVPRSCIVFHSDITMQLGASHLYDFVSVTVLSKRNVENRIKSCSNELDIRICLTLSPICFSSTRESSQHPWCYPDECTSVTTLSPIKYSDSDQNLSQCHTKIEFDITANTLLTNGSIVSVPDRRGVDIKYQLNIALVESKHRKSGKLPSVTAAGEDFSKYFIRAQDVASVTFDNDLTEKGVPSLHKLLNMIPASVPPSKEYLASFLTLEDQIMRRSQAGGFSSLCNTMICGERGTGKTHLLVTMAARLRIKQSVTTVYLDCQKLQSTQTKLHHLLNELSRIFAHAVELQPSIIMLDSLDLLVPNILSSADGSSDGAAQNQQMNPMIIAQSKILADHLKFLMTSLDKSHVFIICTCIDESKVHKLLRSVDTFTSKLQVQLLNEVDRFRLFISTLEKHGACFQCEDLECKRFSKLTEGFVPRDLKIISSKVALQFQLCSFHTSKETVNINDIENTISQYTPISQEALNLEENDTETKFSDVGGLFDAKLSLSSVVLKPIKYHFIYKHAPISLPKGLLLFGFPGCGKSYIVPALAQESGFNIVTCRGPELLDKYIGASEAKVRKLFEKAYAAAPSILFLDEFDALAPRRGSDNTGVTDRVVNQLLTFLDGVEDHGSNNDKIVYIIAASSRPDKIDPALLRPGRLEKHIFVGYPQNNEEFDDLLVKISEKREIDDEVRSMIADGSFRCLLFEHNCQYLSLSAADIKGVFDTAHLSAIHDLLSKSSEAKTFVSIKCIHLLEAFTSARSSLSASDHMMFSRVFAPFRDGDNSPIPSKPLKTALK